MIREIDENASTPLIVQPPPVKAPEAIREVSESEPTEADRQDLAQRSPSERYAEETFVAKELQRGRRVTFSLESEGEPPIIQVRDSRTGETIREIPAEELRQLGDALADMRGILMDRTS